MHCESFIESVYITLNLLNTSGLVWPFHEAQPSGPVKILMTYTKDELKCHWGEQISELKFSGCCFNFLCAYH